MIYQQEPAYLYEIIEDYHSADTAEEKADIVRGFCDSIWNSPNRRRIYTKTIRFKVPQQLLGTELGKIFDTWSEIEYKGFKSLTKETDYASFIRQKVNNLYTRYFDQEVILQAEYLELLKVPKQLYLAWVHGELTAPDEVTAAIDDAIAQSIQVKKELQKEKMQMTWAQYKGMMERFFARIFQNAKLIEEYEETSAVCNLLDCMTEDNFYIRYFCRCLDGMMRNYQKDYYQVKRGLGVRYFRCRECRNLYERGNNNQKYCKSCAAIHRRTYKTAKEKERRNRQKSERGHSENLQIPF